MTSTNDSILAAVKSAQQHSNAAWGTAVDTAGPGYDGGSEERAADMQSLADECDESYDAAIAALEAGDVEAARAALEQCRRLEGEGGDNSDAAGALESLADAARRYTYSIFDADPSASSGDAWPGHDERKIEADSVEEAINEVRDVMEAEAAGLNAADGYEAGDTLHALIWDHTGTIVGTPIYTLTAEDMGE